MKYKNENDNRYWVRFMPSTEELMKQLSVSGFIAYLEANAELEDEDHEWLDGRVVAAKYYLLPETDNLRKEFIVAEDGRVFYWVSVNNKVELVDKEEPKEADEAVEIILEDKPVGNTEKVYHDTPIPKRVSRVQPSKNECNRNEQEMKQEVKTEQEVKAGLWQAIYIPIRVFRMGASRRRNWSPRRRGQGFRILRLPITTRWTGYGTCTSKDFIRRKPCISFRESSSAARWTSMTSISSATILIFTIRKYGTNIHQTFLYN